MPDHSWGAAGLSEVVAANASTASVRNGDGVMGHFFPPR